MATWQHNFNFKIKSRGWTATQGSHSSGFGWVHGDEQIGSCYYRGMKLRYQLPQQTNITKIVTQYNYSSQANNCPIVVDVDSQVYNDAKGYDTGIYFGEGEVIEFVATGQWDMWDDIPGGVFGPNGNDTIVTNPAPGTAVIDNNLKQFSLIGRFGIEADDDWSEWFQIGTASTITVPKSGNLFMICNDVNYLGAFEDNVGSVSVTLTPTQNRQMIRLLNNSNEVNKIASLLNSNISWVGNEAIDEIEIETFCAISTTSLVGSTSYLTLKSIALYGEGLNPIIIQNQDECNSVVGDCSSGISYTGSDNVVFPRNQPISIRNGEKREESTDLTITSPSGLLNFTRSYRQSTQSQTTQYQNLGLGWTHNHAIALDNSISNKLLVRLGNGGVAHFTLDSGTLYKGDPGSASVIDAGGTGSQTYTLTASDKSKYFFDATHRLTQRELPNGEKVTYTYYGVESHADGLLKEVADDYGRKLQFSYIDNSSGFDHLQLWRVGDTSATGLDTSSPSGRYVEFSYVSEKLGGEDDGDGALLYTVRDVRGHTWTYEYYGQQSNEYEDRTKNFLIRYVSPSVDMTGNGTIDDSITLKELEYTVDENEEMVRITQRLGGISGNYLSETEYEFQPDDENITTETVVDNGTYKTTTHYFAGGVYTGAEDAGGNGNFSGMNSQYRPTGVQDANGNITEMVWSGDGKHLESVTDALGNDTAFTYNVDDTLKDSTDATGRKTEYTYGDSNNLRQPTKIVLKEGTTVLKHQEFTYDLKGHVTQERQIDPADGTTILQKLDRSYYTSGDGEGLLESITQYERTGTGTFVVDDSTTYTYDGVGRVIKTAKSSLFGNCQFTYTIYDDAGNVLATACGRENVTPPTTLSGMLALYDAGDAVKKDTRVTVHSYDTLGRRFKTVSNVGMAIEQTLLTVYDALNRVVRTISNYKEDTNIPNPFTASHSAFWHGDGNNENLVTDTTYNAWGMVVRQTDPLGNVTLYGYDNANRVTRIVQYASFPDYEGDPTLEGYGTGEGQQISSDADKDLITSNTYDRVGNLVMTTDVLGNNHFTVYDALNRPVKTVRNAKSSATVAYEIGDSGYVAEDDPRSASYVISTDPDRDIIETTEYDALGRVIRTARLIDNRPTAIWDTTLYGYDALGRQIKVIRNASDADYDIATDPNLSGYTPSTDADKDIISTTTYDGDGRVLYPEDVNGNKTYMVYDGLGRQVKRILNYVSQGGSNPADWMWDDADERWEIGTNNPVDFGSFEDENVVSETHYDGDGRVLWTRDMLGRRNYTVYDNAGRVIRQVANYDPTGLTNSDPADWVWDAPAGRWEDGANNSIARGSHDDKNIVTDMIYDAQGRVYQTIDTWFRTTWTFDSGENFDDGLYLD